MLLLFSPCWCMAYLSIHDLGSCEYVRKVLGLYAARRDEVSVGVGSLRIQSTALIWLKTYVV